VEEASSRRREVPPARGSLELHEEIPSHGCKLSAAGGRFLPREKASRYRRKPLPARGRLETLEDGSSRGRKLRTV